MKNEIIYDKKGRPDIMVTFTAEELEAVLGSNHPVLKVKGREIAELCIAKYPATMIEGTPYSLPFQEPTGNLNFDEAIRFCKAKGAGWHLMTAAEWGAIATISRKAGTLPHGNTNSGKWHGDGSEEGICIKGSSRTLTGSGPATWTHDHTPEGIHDLCGNVWELVGGFRYMNGAVQVIPDNNAAGGADQSADSKEWVPVLSSSGKPVKFNPADDELTLTDADEIEEGWSSSSFGELKTNIEVPELMRQLALFPEEGQKSDEYFSVDTDGETVACRGGGWYRGAGAGLFCSLGSAPRSGARAGIGFRSALVRFSDTCDPDNLDEDQDDQDDQEEPVPNRKEAALNDCHQL